MRSFHISCSFHVEGFSFKIRLYKSSQSKAASDAWSIIYRFNPYVHPYDCARVYTVPQSWQIDLLITVCNPPDSTRWQSQGNVPASSIMSTPSISIYIYTFYISTYLNIYISTYLHLYISTSLHIYSSTYLQLYISTLRIYIYNN